MPLARGCLFIHIPKCAGTSVEVALGIADEYPKIGLEPTAAAPDAATLFGGGLQHLTIREIRSNFPEIMDRQSLVTFSIVRDPVDRFISHFAWKHNRFNDGDLDVESEIPALKAEAEALLELSRRMNIFQWPFDGGEFCPGNSQMFAPDDISRHLLPQCSYLFDRGLIAVDAIYSFGALAALAADLRHRGVINGTLPHRMKGRGSHALRQMVPKATEAVLQEVYRHDTRLFERVQTYSSAADLEYCSGKRLQAATGTEE